MKRSKLLTIFLVLLVLSICLSMFVGCTKKNENMLKNDNGIFKYNSLTELKKDWTLETADSITDDSKVFTMNANEEEDSYSITINTSDTGWANVSQEVKLTAGAFYRVIYNVEITKMTSFTSGENYDGVFISIKEDESFNYKNKEDEDAEGVENDTLMQIESGSGEYALGFKAKSGGNSTLVFNVGTKDAPVSCSVNLKKLTLERVDKDTLLSTNDAGSYETDYYGLKSDFNIFYIVVGALAIALICYFGYFMFQRHLHFNTPDRGYTGFAKKLSDDKVMGVLLVAGVALLIRLIIDIVSTVVASGYTHSIMGYNIEGITTQAMFIAKYGPKDMYKYLAEFATDNSYTYAVPSSSPIQLYLLGLCGLIGRIFEKSGDAYFATMFFIRFFCTLADIGTVVLIYLMIKKSVGNVGATIVAGIYALLPVVFASSALWGYMESISVFLIVLTVYFILKNDYLATAITYFFACMFSMSALFLAPIILFYTILQCIIDVKKVIPASIILVLGFVAFYALNVPFDINFINDDKAFYCFEKAWSELYTNAIYTQNAFNFQNILGNNFDEISTASIVVTIVFILFLLSLVGVAYFKFKNRMNLVLMASAFINMLFVFGNNMNPVSMYISLALMLIYAIQNKEKRIYFSFVAFAVLMFINVSYTELFVSYTANAVGIIENDPVMYVFSSFELVLVLYYIYIVYDIVVSRKVRKVQPMPLNYGEWIVNSVNRIKKAYYKTIIKLQRKN